MSDSTVRNADAMAEDVERDIRVAIWNAAMNGGMGQDLSLAFIRRAMGEPTMKRALAAFSPADGGAGAIPEGMVLVPREPTNLMCRAGPFIDLINPAVRPVTESQADACYRAMLAALAPTETGERGKDG